MIKTLLAGIETNFRLDAEVLLAHVIKKSRTFLFTHPEYELSMADNLTFELLWQRRSSGEPLAYILGEKEFWGLTFRVTPHTLIPRPETEILVEYILNHFPADKTLQLADLGTGSGAIACALAHERPNWQITASDIDNDTLMIAQENAQRLQLANIDFLQSDLFTEFKQQQFDVIVSNPPYIAEGDPHLIDLTFEPMSALVAKDQGYAILQTLCLQAHTFLKPNGLLVLEHGFEQAQVLQEFAAKTPLKWLETINDFSDLPRVTVFAQK